MRIFTVGDRVVLDHPNGIGNEPHQLRGTVVRPPEVSGPREEEMVRQATELGLWVKLDHDGGDPRPRYFLYEYTEQLNAVERLAELDGGAS